MIANQGAPEVPQQEQLVDDQGAVPGEPMIVNQGAVPVVETARQFKTKL